jgi:hypothetical protein
MTLTFHDIRQTPAFLAVQLRKIFFGPLSLVLYVLLLSPLLANEALRRDPEPLAIVAALMAGWIWILHRFIVDKLTAMSQGPIHGLKIAEQLSYHMVQHLSSKLEITPTTILKAAMESERGLFVLHQLDLGQKTILETIKEHPIKCPLQDCLDWLTEAVKDLETERLDSTATIYAFLTHIEELKALVFKADLSLEDLKSVLRAEAFHFYLRERRRHAFSPEALVRILGSLGRSWVIGYNTSLNG